MAGTITVGELLSDPTSGNKITIGSGTTLDLKSGAGDVVMPSGSVVATYTDSLTAPVVFNSATYADSGLSITLTPESTSSKFIINISNPQEIYKFLKKNKRWNQKQQE